MTIDWLSLLIGVGIGIFLINLVNVITTTINYRRAKKTLETVTNKIEKARNELEKERIVIERFMDKIEEKK